MGAKYYSRKSFSTILAGLGYILISLFLALGVFSIQDLEYNSWLKLFSFVVILQCIFQCLFLKLISIKIFSLAGMFILLTYLFHFGQLLIMEIIPNYEFQRINYFVSINQYDMQRTATFCLVAISMVGLGMMFSGQRNIASAAKKGTNLVECRKVGWILVCFCFPIQLYLDTRKVLISASEGYLATYNTGIVGIWGAVGFIAFIGFSLLIFGYREQRIKSLAIFLSVLVYLLLTMMTGHRGHQITIMIFLIYIIHRTVYRIDWKKLLFVCMAGFLGLAVISTLATFRGIQHKTISDFWELFLIQLERNPIIDLIAELGGTIKTPYLVFQQVPSLMPYAYGKTYPAGIFSVLPNIGGLFTNINLYAYYYKSIAGNALGGSYLGELYYNFSYYGIFFAAFIGSFISRISKQVENLIIQQDYLRLAYLTPAFIYILWWPRDSFYSMNRPVIWGAVALFIVDGIVKSYFLSHNNSSYQSAVFGGNE